MLLISRIGSTVTPFAHSPLFSSLRLCARRYGGVLAGTEARALCAATAVRHLTSHECAQRLGVSTEGLQSSQCCCKLFQ